MSNMKTGVLAGEHVADHTAEPQIVFPDAREAETGIVSNTRATSDDDENKSLLFPPMQSELLQRRDGSVGAASCLMAGTAALLSIGSIIVAALEVRDTVVYSHTYAGGTYDEELMQALLIATIVEACIFLAATTMCFGVLMGRPSTAVLCRSQRTAFLCVCVSALVLFAFALYTVVLQALCAIWDGAYPMYIIQCIFAAVRALLVCGLLTFFYLH